MTREEFLVYAVRRPELFSQEQLDSGEYAVLPCHCTHYSCKGWALVPNTPLCIEEHNRFYGPKT